MKKQMKSSELDFTFLGSSPQVFSAPDAVFVAQTSAQAWEMLGQVEHLLADGFAIAGFLSYELGYSCVNLPTPAHHPARELPYLILGAFAPRQPGHIRNATMSTSNLCISPLRSRTKPEQYAQAVQLIQKQLTDGEVYQVNFSVPFDFDIQGNPLPAFEIVAAQTQAPYAASLRCENTVLLSWSPELFFQCKAERITTKPMKGTAPRDAEFSLASAKNQAEHIMIVDLLRNDLSRICDRVWVERLFEREKYPTFQTMTSTICGERKPNLPFTEIIRAMFPCGSVTGAPKRAAMAEIAAREHFPRDAYCGSLGYLLPNGDGEWNVAIRTAQFNTARGVGRLDLGGGIVADSQWADEWAELWLKGRFFRDHFGLGE